MGTTLVGGVIKDNGSGYIINVGDSRAYLLKPKKGEIRQITQDHSLVAELIRFGAITPEEARNHPRKNVITRALGTEAQMDSDFYSFKLGAGDLLLLCSDGLSNQVRDEELLEEAKSHKEPDELCRRLMEMVLERGAKDNVTVVVVTR
jgi:protein phosphatase